MDANKILSADLLDILFEDRNKDYGAYELRRSYNKRILMALIITASVALLALLGSILMDQFASKKPREEVREVTIQDIKQQEEPPKELPPPPPPKPPEPPKIETKQFTPPKIVKDEEVQQPPPPQEDLSKAKISLENQAGTEDKGIVDAPPPDQGKQILEVKPPEDENKVFEKVEVEASFKGGEGAWRKYLEKTLNPNVPVDNGAPEGTYTVWVQFIVDKQGAISDVRALTNHGFGMEDEAVKVIKKGPPWNPAQQNGRYVKAFRKQPITFVVTSE